MAYKLSSGASAAKRTRRSRRNPSFSSNLPEARLSCAVMATIRDNPNALMPWANTADAASKAYPCDQNPGQECETDVDVLERVALDETAEADGLATRLQFHQVQAETQAPVHVARTRVDVVARVFQRPHALVADELQPGGLVQQLQNEGRVIRCEPSQLETLGFQDLHVCSSPSAAYAMRAVDCNMRQNILCAHCARMESQCALQRASSSPNPHSQARCCGAAFAVVADLSGGREREHR